MKRLLNSTLASLAVAQPSSRKATSAPSPLILHRNSEIPSLPVLPASSSLSRGVENLGKSKRSLKPLVGFVSARKGKAITSSISPVNENFPTPVPVIKARPRSSFLLKAPSKELRLWTTLACGQVFTWEQDADRKEVWRGTVGKYAYKLEELRDDVKVTILNKLSSKVDQKEAKRVIFDYLHLGKGVKKHSLINHSHHDERNRLQLATLLPLWKRRDPTKRLSLVAPHVPGLRILRQDPIECLFSFLCSSNNNVQRIGQILKKVKREIGTPIRCEEMIGKTGEKKVKKFKLYSFPTLAQLRKTQPRKYWKLGMGYRAEFVHQSAQFLSRRDVGGERWLHQLRKESDRLKVQELLRTNLHGVGPKVADCVSLFCLDQLSVVPVDTHVLKMTKRDGLLSGGKKKKKKKNLGGNHNNHGGVVMRRKVNLNTVSLTPSVHQMIGQAWIDRFGPLAGWAHSLLFAGELPMFKKALAASAAGKRKKKTKPNAG